MRYSIENITSLSTIANRLYSLRIESHTKVSKLAEYISENYSKTRDLDSIRTEYYKWENGTSQPSLEMLLHLCNFYDCEIDYLLGKIEEKKHLHADIKEETGLSTEAINRIVTPRGNLFLDTLITSEEFYKIDMLFDAIHRDYHLAESYAKEMRKLELEYATYQDNSIEKQEINIMYDKYQDNVNRAEERIASGMYRISLFWGNALESYRNKRNKIIQSILQLTDNS